MSIYTHDLAKGYDTTYQLFDSPLMQKIRTEAYGEDIGQHSWITADQLRGDIAMLGLSNLTHLLDYGCGPGGPLTFLVKATSCRAVGIDLSAAALDVASRRVASLGLGGLASLQAVDANGPLPFNDTLFDVAVSYDVVLHLQSRENAFRELARVLKPQGQFLFTDAGVVTGPVTNEEIRLRSINGFTQFVPDGYNEAALRNAGFRLLERRDRTQGILDNARGRTRARTAHRAELIAIEGEEKFAREQQYLDVVARLSERQSLSRVAYLAESSREASV